MVKAALTIVLWAMLVGPVVAWAQDSATCADYIHDRYAYKDELVGYILRIWRPLNESRVAMGCEPVKADDYAGNYEGLLDLVTRMCNGNGPSAPLYDTVMQTYRMVLGQQISVNQMGFGDRSPAQCR
jgi:hypothetical protein